MSRAVWQHKRQSDVRRQAWNLPELPDLLKPAEGISRLYVAIGGYWRGYFRLEAFSWNPTDVACPFTLLFDPSRWTPIHPESAPPRDRRRGYTLDVPGDHPITHPRERDKPCLSGEGNENKQRERKRD